MARFLFAIFIALLAANTVVASEIYIPTGWRLPTEEDMTGTWAKFRKNNLQPYLAQADFNGDGVRDDAYIALATQGSKWALFVNLNNKNGIPLVIKLNEDSGVIPPQRIGVDTAGENTYKTACGKGYWECEKCDAETLELKLPAISYYQFESANSFFWWDKKLRKFRRTWMSD